MTDWRYLQVFGDATDALLRYAGVDDDYRRAGGAVYTVESQLTHRAEARVHEKLYVSTRVTEIDEKRLRLSHSLIRTHDEALIATAQQLYLHVDTAARRSAPFAPAVRARLAALQAGQRS